MVRAVLVFSFFALFAASCARSPGESGARPETLAMDGSHEDKSAAIKDLCRQDIEGTYQGTLDTDKVRLNLVCLPEGGLAATICPQIDNAGHFSIDLVTNLVWAAVDGDRLILSNFALENDARAGGSSKSIISYLQLDLAALQGGEVKGVYMSGSMADFQSIDAKRIQKYPRYESAASAPLAAAAVAGVFRTNMPEDKVGMNLIFNNLLETPVISIVGVYSRFVNHFTKGPTWDPSGVFSSSTPEGNGGEPDDKKLNLIRGRFLDADRLEFYLINPTLGMRGPFVGNRIRKLKQDRPG